MSNEKRMLKRREWLNQGLCGSCGKEKSKIDKTECEYCREIRSKSQKKNYAKNRKTIKDKQYQDRIVVGNCARCGILAAEIGRVCKKCYEYNKKYVQDLKDATYNAYGGYICNCCGEKIKEFLTIDHKNNDGALHRKTIKAGKAFYLWLRKNNYPGDFQVMCMSCNFGKRINGICPHKWKENQK